ncbi:4-hydroxy-2-oxovalerate aldolase [Patulibacter medicamentivorans]|uniref:4-hydroxy-2-oxovalerate aldolase n=1 Tax=Patulibacter medicamentivorans TaxID=1097667 RepID=H0DZT2_9ACTN|nr:4-hydroxy-2-oxovalerate aldolase [Patulibacter medicamentivorans]EHN13036.1 4-hydroxy-2-oxovalerate aldolase [Patulibacter medicamentivorans]
MTFSADLDVRVTDSSLRDGSHAVAHRFTVEQVRAMVAGMDAAGVPVIEVAHGDGLGGSTLTYGRSLVDERELIAAAVETARAATIASLILPGVGTVGDIRAARDLGVGLLRVATHASEADIAAEHLRVARELGMETAGFLMMSHTLTPDALAAQARVMADDGCECVYVVDSAGAMVLDEVAERVTAVVQELGDDAQVGFHAHRNLGVGEANSLVAVRAGAVQIDGSLRAFGAGSGNAQTEVVVALLDRAGLRTGIDVAALLDVAEDVAAPLQPAVPVVDRDAVTLGLSGVYSSFLAHARRIGAEYGVPAHELLRDAGERGLVGGQEDLLVDIAVATTIHRSTP